MISHCGTSKGESARDESVNEVSRRKGLSLARLTGPGSSLVSLLLLVPQLCSQAR